MDHVLQCPASVLSNNLATVTEESAVCSGCYFFVSTVRSHYKKWSKP